MAAIHMPPCLYAFLGLDANCSPSSSQINKAYRRKAVELHPDKPSGSHELFQVLSRVFLILSDPESRGIYNAYGLAAVDQHLQNQEVVMQLEEEYATAGVAEDIPDGHGWRELGVGEAVAPGSTLKMDMATGRSFVLQRIRADERLGDIDADAVATPVSVAQDEKEEGEEDHDDVAPMGFYWCDCGLEGRRLVPLENVPADSFRDFVHIRKIVLDHRWEISRGEFVVFKFQSGVDNDVFEAYFNDDGATPLFSFEIVEHNLFRNDWGGDLAKLFRRGDGCYVLQTRNEVWTGHRRTPPPEEPQHKKPRYANMALDVLLLSLFEWKLGDIEYVWNKRGKNFYVAEARRPTMASKTYDVRIERTDAGSQVMIVKDTGAQAIMLRKDGCFAIVLPNGDEFVSTKYRSYIEARAAQGAAYGL